MVKNLPMSKRMLISQKSDTGPAFCHSTKIQFVQLAITNLYSYNFFSPTPFNEHMADKKEGDFLIKQKKNLEKKYVKRIGLPPEYHKPEDMLFMIRQYVEDGCKIGRKVVGRNPNQRVIEFRRLSYYGLITHLGFSSRKQMNAYATRNSRYTETIKYAKTLIAEYYEELAQDGVSPTFMNFMLHNIDGLVMSKEDQDGGYEKKTPKLKFTNHDKSGKVKDINGKRSTGT